MSRRRRVFAEHISPEALSTSAPLLARYGLEPLVALPPDRTAPGPLGARWARALRDLSDALGGVGLWPLLDDDAGYWLNPRNLAFARARVDQVLQFARSAGARVHTVCLDVEPAPPVLRALSGGPVSAVRGAASQLSRWASWSVGGRSGAPVLGPSGLRPPSSQAQRQFSALVAQLRARELEVYVTQLPFAAWPSPLPVVLRGPANVEALMLYSTLMSRWVPSRRLAAALFEATARRHARQTNPAPALALGCVGTGKLGDEPVWTTPSALRRDVEGARAAGIDDLALFCLEGVLARPQPEAWLDAFTAG